MAQEVGGKSLEAVRRLHRAVRDLLQGKGPPPGTDLGDLEALEGVAQFPVRVKCALLPWSTLLEALDGAGGRRATRKATTESPDEGGA